MKQEHPHTTLQEQNSPEQIQSHTIDMLRFPLAVMVIFIHMNPIVTNLIDADFSLISARGILNVIEITLSHTLTHIAVPTFFLISGFLFFLNFKQWSWSGYKKKMKSRVRTLIIPYLMWNFCCLLFVLCTKLGAVLIKGKPISEVYSYLAEKSWHIFYDCHLWGTHKINWLGDSLYNSGPLDLPLWFLRDLIIVSLLTPVIYYFVKRTKIWGVLFLFLAYISRIWTQFPGFSITAFFFYSLGAYFALNGMNLVLFVKRFKNFILPLAILLLCACTMYDGTNTIIGQNIYPFFICSGVFAAFYIASFFVEHYHLKPNNFLVSSCFFIYAFHGASFFPLIGSPLTLSRRIMHLIIPGQSTLEEGICYLTAPFLAAFICILTLIIFKKLSPKLALLFSGNR